MDVVLNVDTWPGATGRTVGVLLEDGTSSSSTQGVHLHTLHGTVNRRDTKKKVCRLYRT